MSDALLIVLQLAIVFLSVMLHEVAHAVVARNRGDHTAEHEGRITLNPLAHIDPIGTVILPALLALFHLPILGWAKPVPVRPSHLRSPRQDWMMVSLAGPFTNFGLAVVAALLLRLVPGMPALLVLALLQVVVINFTLAVFNLIPLPPMDGSRVVMRFLPPRALEAYLRFEGRSGMLLIYLLLGFGILGRMIDPIIAFLVTRALGIPLSP